MNNLNVNAKIVHNIKEKNSSVLYTNDPILNSLEIKNQYFCTSNTGTENAIRKAKVENLIYKRPFRALDYIERLDKV
jgi:hypothetical protein